VLKQSNIAISSETPQTFHFLEAKSSVPLKQEFKPAVTVLSRRPQNASRQAGPSGVGSATAGIARLGLNADRKDLSDSEDEANRAPELTPEERQAKALRDREEKQRKYEEVRERLFGSSSNPGSGTSSPGTTTPPPSSSSRQYQNSGEGRNRGRNRGGARDRDRENHREKRNSPGSSGRSGQLYDPGYSAKPNPPYLQRKERQYTERSDSEQQAPRQPTRSPRGPDGSGRGGFGFSPRGRGA
jgi:hypothetical protein